MYNTKKDYVLDFLDRNSSNSSSSGSNHNNTYTPNHGHKQISNNIESIENNNNNNSKNNCIIEVNNTNFNRHINRTLSSHNINSVLSNESTSLLDESSNTYSLSKSESFHSNHSDPLQKSFKKDENNQRHQKHAAPKIVSNYERFPYIRNRQITPQPNTKYLSNYTNYYNVSKRTKSNGPDTNRISSANQQQQQQQLSNSKNESVNSKPAENSLVKSVSADHINQLEHATDIQSQETKTNKVSSLLNNYESPNKLRSAHNRSLTSLASTTNQDKRNSVLVESTENATKPLNTLNELPTTNGSMSNLTKKFRQLQPPEKEESELDRVFKVNNIEK